jgi:uncharacterized membrane protein
MYPILKLLHVASVVLFLGNIITGLFWHAHAARTRDPRLIAHAMDGIIRADRWFTIPSVVMITLTGILAAIRAHLPLLHTPWITASLALFTLSGVMFVARVAPLQRRLHALAEAGTGSGGFDAAAYHRLARSWEFWGALALMTPLLAMALMVLKPGR